MIYQVFLVMAFIAYISNASDHNQIHSPEGLSKKADLRTYPSAFTNHNNDLQNYSSSIPQLAYPSRVVKVQTVYVHDSTFVQPRPEEENNDHLRIDDLFARVEKERHKKRESEKKPKPSPKFAPVPPPLSLQPLKPENILNKISEFSLENTKELQELKNVLQSSVNWNKMGGLEPSIIIPETMDDYDDDSLLEYLSGRYKYLIIRDDDRTINGLLIFTENSDTREIIIYGCYENCFDHGISLSYLYRKLEEISKQRGYANIKVIATDQKEHNFYVRHGYKLPDKLGEYFIKKLK